MFVQPLFQTNACTFCQPFVLLSTLESHSSRCNCGCHLTDSQFACCSSVLFARFSDRRLSIKNFVAGIFLLSWHWLRLPYATFLIRLSVAIAQVARCQPAFPSDDTNWHLDRVAAVKYSVKLYMCVRLFQYVRLDENAIFKKYKKNVKKKDALLGSNVNVDQACLKLSITWLAFIKSIK